MTTRRISREQMVRYLDKLAMGSPVPELKLRQAAREFNLDLEALLHGAQRQHVKRDLVTYMGVDPDVLGAWRRAAQPGHTSPRIDNALRGNSHNARVGGAMLTVRSRRQAHPQVVLVDEAGVIAMPEGARCAPLAVIVENMENFLDLDGTLRLFPACGLPAEWQDADILYGSGNSITNHLFTALFQQYQAIGCLFDPDPGGVRMCDTLYQRGNLPPLHFLAPHDLPERLSSSTRALEPSARETLTTHMRRSPPVARVAGLIRQTGRHLEQETYLAPCVIPRSSS